MNVLKKMCLFMLLLALIFTLTACGEDMPKIVVHTGYFASNQEISIGNRYQYTGFRTEPKDGGMELIVTFTERTDKP